MADWTYAYRRTLPDSSYACIDAGGIKDDNGHTDEAHRHYPIRDKDGMLDEAHVRNALSRLAQDDTTSCGASKIRAAAKELGIGQPAGKSIGEAWVNGIETAIKAEVPTADLATPLKFVGKDTIEGPVFVFGRRDLHGETFTPDTDFCLEWFGKSGRPTLYEHGLDSSMKAGVVGRQIDYEARAEGIWAQSQLDLNARFRKGVDRLINEGALSYSGGAMQHLASRDSSGNIKRFPWVELSLTPTPAQPENAGVYYLKSADAVSHLEMANVEIPAPLKAALFALDEWAETRDETLPDGASFADAIDRLTVDAAARVNARKSWHLKSGRVLSAATRERLAAHPKSLRQLADDLDELLSMADAGKSGVDIWEQFVKFQAAESRRLGVPLPETRTQ